MSRLGLRTVLVYHGEMLLGELEVVAVKERKNFQFVNREIRIHHLTPPGERCPPLSILQTISSFSVLCKLESPSSPSQLTTSVPPVNITSLNSPFPMVEQSPLTCLHATCFHEAKTAVTVVGEEEIHLVAMPSKLKKFPCFWCFSSPIGLYESCLTMLNLRCLAIVFDLDETLIVANTMKSFEDKIETLRSWIARELDPVRVSGMSAELKRYSEDRLLLKQYIENDYAVDANGKIVKVQMEEVSLVAESQEKLIRPVVRLPDRSIVLTRINPEIRDTSVLVRLRPAWEDLRSYLTARGRKRFEVYVCTMAERDYALEIWRLLDPEAHLISRKQLSNRLVCVKSGCRKSLSTVFQDGSCHPKMAMVVDDRSKVWEEKDQPRVHVVPPFTPYYAPQAETANAVPVLCVARNVACNVRGYFFKEFDENLIRKILEVFFEDDILTLPVTPDVSNFMISEDAGFVPNGNGGATIHEGISGVEVEKRLSQSDEKSLDPNMELPQTSLSFTHTVVPPPVPVPKGSFCGVGVKRDFRVQALNHPLNSSRSSSLPSPVPPFRPFQEPDSLKAWAAPNQSSASNKVASQTSLAKAEEALPTHDPPKPILPPATQATEVSMPSNAVIPEIRGPDIDVSKSNAASIEVLKEIGRRCSSEIKYKSIVCANKDLKFSVEVFFTGEKIGHGVGKTKKIAQQQAANNALHFLADKYVAYFASCSSEGIDEVSVNENGFVYDTCDEE